MAGDELFLSSATRALAKLCPLSPVHFPQVVDMNTLIEMRLSAVGVAIAGKEIQAAMAYIPRGLPGG
jgi:hypothetical protein